MKSTRGYNNASREQAAAETREEILQACLRVLSTEGLEALSIQAVAKEAGIASRTVFRHFPTRDVLLEEAWKKVISVTGMEKYPQTEEELRSAVRRVFELFDKQPQLVRSLVLSPGGWEVRMRGNAMRHTGLNRAMAEVLEGLPMPKKKRAIGIVHTLFSASAWQMLRDRDGMTGKEAGEAVAWAIETLLESLRREPRG